MSDPSPNFDLSLDDEQRKKLIKEQTEKTKVAIEETTGKIYSFAHELSKA